MATPNWRLFAVIALLATIGLLVLSHVSARALRALDPAGTGQDAVDDSSRPHAPTGASLQANVALTHGLLGVSLVGLIWWTGVPVTAVGLGPIHLDDIVVGLGLGGGLYLASEATTALARRVGLDPDERLRALLAPEGRVEWVLLIGVVLPLIATTEELLFRGILVGGLAAGFDVSPALLVVGSSALFGLGHSAQGGLGVAVTAGLGLVLGVGYAFTGSLVVVVVAHYVVDVLEFSVREWLLG